MQTQIDAGPVWVLDALPGTEIRTWATEAQYVDGSKMCPQYFPNDVYFAASLKIWNRTGLASFQEAVFRYPQDPYPELRAVLPPDPPYLVMGGVPCQEHFMIEATTVSITELPSYEPGTGFVRFDDDVWLEASVAPLALNGRETFTVSPQVIRILMMVGVPEIDATVVGHGYFYAPNSTATGGDWILHHDRVFNDYEMSRFIPDMPGPFTYVINQTPSQQETHWRVRLEWWEFKPNVTELGFSYPFASYVDCTHGAYEGRVFKCASAA